MALRDGVGLARHGERRQAPTSDLPAAAAGSGQPLGQGLGDLARVPAGPDARAVDAAAAAVEQTLSTMMSRYFSQLIDLVVAEQDLAEAGAVRLHARVALVPLDGRRAAEDQAAAQLSSTAAPISPAPG